MSKTIFVKDQEINYIPESEGSFCSVCGADIPKKRGRRFCLSCWLELQKRGVLV